MVCANLNHLTANAPNKSKKSNKKFDKNAEVKQEQSMENCDVVAQRWLIYQIIGSPSTPQSYTFQLI